jgi:phenylacetic acid degradation operon negative regulatory protein
MPTTRQTRNNTPEVPADGSTNLMAERIGTARSLLLTLLGEFVLPRERPVRTAASLHALGGTGIAEKVARQAIMRAAAAGWIAAHPVGRQTCWTVGDYGRHVIEEGAQRVRSMSRSDTAWDGCWLVIVIAEQESERSHRQKVARALSWVGFGQPTPGLWVSPHTSREDEARRLLIDLGIADSTHAFVGPSSRAGMGDRQLVERSWDLDAVAEHDAVLTRRFGRLRASAGDPMLFSYVQLVNEWQRIPFIDPGLPQVLLPPQWPGRERVARLEALREAWSEQAHRRWDEVAGVVPTP